MHRTGIFKKKTLQALAQIYTADCINLYEKETKHLNKT